MHTRVQHSTHWATPPCPYFHINAFILAPWCFRALSWGGCGASFHVSAFSGLTAHVCVSMCPCDVCVDVVCVLCGCVSCGQLLPPFRDCHLAGIFRLCSTCPAAPRTAREAGAAQAGEGHGLADGAQCEEGGTGCGGTLVACRCQAVALPSLLTVNPTVKGKGRWLFLNSRLAWSTWGIPGRPGYIVRSCFTK